MGRQVVVIGFGEPAQNITIRDIDVPVPGPGQVLIRVRAAGMNPADISTIRGLFGANPDMLPLPIGREVAGVIEAIGPDSRLATGHGQVGDEVIAYQVRGGYADHVLVAAGDVFPKPSTLGFPQAAGLMLAGTTAADMLRAVPVGQGDTALVHGASGSVGISLLQQLATTGARVLGTASPANFDLLRSFGAEPIPHGPGLPDRVRDAVGKITAAYDTVGTDEAVDSSLELLQDRTRFVTIAAFARAERDGLTLLAGTEDSRTYRNAVRPLLTQLAQQGRLTVPIARTFPLDRAGDALALLATRHPGGKLVLIP